jgi:C1A family cysteine protease
MAETPEPDPESLLQQNAVLKARLEEYKKLEEDLMAKRVFDKARGYLTTWITLGGIILTLAGFVGYRSVMSYFSDLAKKKAEAITEVELHKIVETSVNIRVDARVDQSMPGISERVFKRVTQRAEPLAGTLAAGTTSATAVTASQKPAKTSVDWSADMAPPRDSGQEGSVVGLALAATLEFYVFKSAGSHVAISGRDIYNEVRAKTGALDQDSGALIKDGIEFLKKTGAVEENAWPYRAGEYAKSPPPALARAKRYQITEAKPIATLDELKAALDSGPAISGITLYETFQSVGVATTGVIPMPKPKDVVIGGHAICIVGYDDQPKLLKFQNTWGKDWGDHGYGYLPYDYFREQSGDSWTFRYSATADH